MLEEIRCFKCGAVFTVEKEQTKMMCPRCRSIFERSFTKATFAPDAAPEEVIEETVDIIFDVIDDKEKIIADKPADANPGRRRRKKKEETDAVLSPEEAEE